jgi:antitoxin (DNA-binding transcriptional repressor) of toxin-antitoxin stability system
MTAVSVREFSYNPSAMFARVEKGETIEVTRHGKVIATIVPRQRGDKYAELVASGQIRPGSLTSRDLDRYPTVDIPDDVDPLRVLLEMRDEDADR